MIGFDTMDSGVAACVIDGLSIADTAKALGTGHGFVHHRVQQLMYRFRARDMKQLAEELTRIAWRD